MKVLGVVRNFQKALAQRGGWGNFFGGGGLLEHMYTNGDYPFKFGTHVGTDEGGNKYFENTVDYPYGQHRWVEYADIHNYDPTSIPPAWHSWMHYVSDTPGNQEDQFFEDTKKDIKPTLNTSHAPYDHGVAFQNPPPENEVNYMHNLSQLRARGWGVGNSVFMMGPDAKDQYYKQPGSPYNPKSREGGSFMPRDKFDSKTDADEAMKLANVGEYPEKHPDAPVRRWDASDNSSKEAPTRDMSSN